MIPRSVKVAKGALACLGLLMSAPGFAQAHLDLQSLRGRVVYVDFWASWCTPFNLDHDQADAQRFLRMFKPNFPVIFDPAGTLAQRFNVMAMPTSVLIDRTGKIRYEHAGFLLKQRAEYERQIRDLLAQK